MRGHQFNPWHRLRDLGPSWKLRWHDEMPDEHTYGFTKWADRTINLRSGMSFEERRCTIAHEVEHVLRGPFSRCQEMGEEVAVNRHCARLLLPGMQAIADALVWAHGNYEAAAEQLWVDPWTLEVRLGSLHGIERRYLDRRLAEVCLDGS